MKEIQLFYGNSLVSATSMQAGFEQLEEVVDHMIHAFDQGYATKYASLYLPFDDQMMHNIMMLVQQKQKLKPTILIVIGIGGSSLGTLAMQQALQGVWYNIKTHNIKIYYADGVDPDYLTQLLEICDRELKHGNTILLNVVSKSGTTTETVVNFTLFLDLIRIAMPDRYRDYVVVTTDKDSALWQVAQQEQFSCLEIPAMVGGRYSVFSAVGLFPLALLGIDIATLCEGARHVVERVCIKDVEKNYAALSALVLYAQYQQHIRIHDTFLFATDLTGVGAWYRQLLAESIGKEYTRDGKQEFIGITPTVSIGTIDLHSVAQLYLGGPFDKITTFISVQTFNTSLSVPMIPSCDKLVANIHHKSVSSIQDAILGGVLQAYQKGERPFMHIVLPEKNPRSLGQLLQLKMVEVMYLGYLLEVNPFDQPQVALYKQETRKILAHE